MKLRIIRCLKTGFAIFLISSIFGVGSPFKIAPALAAKTKKELERGPAPHSIYFFVISGHLFIGLVLCERLTAYSITLSAIGISSTNF